MRLHVSSSKRRDMLTIRPTFSNWQVLINATMIQDLKNADIKARDAYVSEMLPECQL